MIMTKEKKGREEEGSVQVSVFISIHNYSLNAYEYRLNGEDQNVFYPFLKVALNANGKCVGIKVGSKKNFRTFKLNQLIRYRKIK